MIRVVVNVKNLNWYLLNFKHLEFSFDNQPSFQNLLTEDFTLTILSFTVLILIELFYIIFIFYLESMVRSQP